MLPIPGLLIALLVLVCFSAFFSASEAALIALNKVRLRHMLENKKSGSGRVYGLVSRMDKLIATILIGNNLVNTAIAAIGTLIFTHWFGERDGVIIGTIVISVILILSCELTPTILATNHPEGVAFTLRHAVSFFIRLFGPLAYVLTLASNGFIRLIGGDPYARSPRSGERRVGE